MSGYALDIALTVNGERISERVDARKTLVDFLREDLALTGSHVGCEHGVCGACTVLVDGEPVRSCLMLAVQAAGREIRTVEGLANGDELNPLQRAFMEHHGLQCGFCTPGMIMAAVDIVKRKGGNVSEAVIREELDGNICRCTGYHNIIAAVRAGAVGMAGMSRRQAAE